jgi:hypothetical protein
MKPLSILLTKILTAMKKRLQMHCATAYMPEVGYKSNVDSQKLKELNWKA